MAALDLEGEMQVANKKRFKQRLAQGEENKEKEAVLGLNANGIPIEIITKPLKTTEAKVSRTIGGLK